MEGLQLLRPMLLASLLWQWKQGEWKRLVRLLIGFNWLQTGPYVARHPTSLRELRSSH